jgi:hypothetical protein
MMCCGTEHPWRTLAAASRLWSAPFQFFPVFLLSQFNLNPAFLIQKRLNRTNPVESNPHMKIKLPLSLLAAASLALSSAAFAAGAKTYQVTGPVLEVTDSMIVIEKGAKKERWEINRDANTKVTGDLKVGEKVTVTYTMTATDAEVKAGKGGKKDKNEAAKAAPTP